MILALDPSLCCTGWVLAPAKDSPVGELLCGVITTEPAPKKQRLYVAEDDAQRALKVCRALLDLKVRDRDCLVVSEQPAGSRHARSASALKLIQGALVGLRVPEEPIRWVTALEAKVALCGRKGASKDQMVEAARRRGLKMAGNKPACEAMADAFAVLLASGLWRPS
jgi:Holliday junction resolvasome RuvABC endonuclease subunit